MRAQTDWQADDVLQLVDHSSWLCDLTKHTLKSTREHAHSTAHTTGPQKSTILLFLLPWAAFCSSASCPSFILVCSATKDKDGRVGGPGVWEVRLCTPGWGDDGAVYGEPEAEVRPDVPLERRKGGEQLGVRDVTAFVSYIYSMKHHIN